MSPIILIAVSIIAISLLVAANVWIGGWTASRVPSLAAAEQRLREDYLAFPVGKGVLTKDGRAALIAEQDGERTGLVVVQGDVLVSRLVSRQDLSSADRNGTHLHVRFRDFTFPAAKMEFETEDAAQLWQKRLLGEESRHA